MEGIDMKRALLLIISLLAVAMIGTAYAIPIEVGDTIRFYDREGTTGGGEFGVGYAPYGDEMFRTFCVQRDEYLDFSPQGFTVVGINKAVQLQDDPISAGTAYLFYQFSTRALVGYDYTTGSAEREASANALQYALWKLEGEWTGSLTGQALTWYNDALGASSDYLEKVNVLNIVYATTRGNYVAGTPAQDVLALVPEPGIMILLGFGLMAIGAYRRKK